VREIVLSQLIADTGLLIIAALPGVLLVEMLTAVLMLVISCLWPILWAYVSRAVIQLPMLLVQLLVQNAILILLTELARTGVPPVATLIAVPKPGNVGGRAKDAMTLANKQFNDK